MYMVRYNFYLRNDQERFLRKIPGTVSEHIRIAIDEYIFKKRQEVMQVSNSLSKMKIFYQGKEVEHGNENYESNSEEIG